jgi:magnesium-transporting ATPase (P-type)
VHESELFAADMVLIATSNSDGTCFVQTAQLDGEKSLKKKHIPKGLAEVIP